MNQRLHQRRIDAAQASQGTSSPAIYQPVLRAIAARGVRGDLLEFGAGTGSLARLLLASAFPGCITAADILPRPPDLPAEVRWIPADLNDRVSATDASFDAIVATEVIEHLENPRAVFRELGRLLRPGGWLLVTTPNQESLRSLAALVVRGHFVAFLDGSYPAHITALLRTDFARLCAEAGFAAPEFSYTNSGGIPGLAAVSWQQVSGGLLRGRWFSDNVIVSTRRAGREDER